MAGVVPKPCTRASSEGLAGRTPARSRPSSRLGPGRCLGDRSRQVSGDFLRVTTGAETQTKVRIRTSSFGTNGHARTTVTRSLAATVHTYLAWGARFAAAAAVRRIDEHVHTEVSAPVGLGGAGARPVDARGGDAACDGARAAKRGIRKQIHALSVAERLPSRARAGARRAALAGSALDAASSAVRGIDRRVHTPAVAALGAGGAVARAARAHFAARASIAACAAIRRIVQGILADAIARQEGGATLADFLTAALPDAARLVARAAIIGIVAEIDAIAVAIRLLPTAPGAALASRAHL